MIDILLNILFVYALGVALIFFIGTIYHLFGVIDGENAYWKDVQEDGLWRARHGARVAFAAPLWPMILVLTLARWFARMWRYSKMKEED